MWFNPFATSRRRERSECTLTGRKPDATTSVRLPKTDGSELAVQAECIASTTQPLSGRWIAEITRTVSVFKDTSHRLISHIVYRDTDGIVQHIETDVVKTPTDLEELLLLHDTEEIASRLNSESNKHVTARTVVDDIRRTWYTQITCVLESVTEWENADPAPHGSAV